MKFLIVLALVAAASADVLNSDATAPIVRDSFDITENQFSHAFESGNGIVAQAEGIVKNPNSDEPTLEIKGSYAYTSPEGVPVRVSYVADENGYQPQGDLLPVPPPVPEAIARSLAYIAAHPAKVVEAVPYAASKLLG